ncbi:MAG: hypothetical protein JJE44_07825 [Flavobacteriaceae bacterium]|nr:hypothetical protein [Flavobacteriaceae bacterium]
MIDFLKIVIFKNDLINDLFNSSLLNEYSIYQSYTNNLNKEAQEIRQATFTKVFKEIYFCFYVKKDEFTKLEVLIKPHYYFNNNLHNANDFTALDCIKVLNEIKDIFNFPTKELHIINKEFGLNCLSPIDCKDLITYTIYHEKNEFITSSDNLKFSKISFKHDKYGKANNYKKIKFYAKGLQFPQYTDINTFRFEVKSKRSSYIKSLGIKTYADLLNIETYLTLAENIKAEFKNVLILDISNKGQNLNPKDKIKLTEHLNTFKWIKAIQGSKNTFNNTKKTYLKLLDKTGNNIHNKLEKIISDKLNFLVNDCAILTPSKQIKDCAIFNTYIMENGTINNKRKCSVTGIELTHENEGAKYIRTSTLNYLHNYDKNRFEEVCSYLLSKTNGNRPKFESDIIKHLAKQVRNRYFNPSIIRQTGYKQRKYYNQIKLF